MPIVSIDDSFSSKMGGQIVQRVDSYLKGEGTRAIERGAYSSFNRFMAVAIKRAALIAQAQTQRKYPMAKERDESRRPVPGVPHLEDSWTYQLPSGRGGAKLVNTRPGAAMLLIGFDTPSTFDTASDDTPLYFPRRPLPQHKAVSKASQNVRITRPITRPVPASQQQVELNNAIPYLSIRAAIRQGRR